MIRIIFRYQLKIPFTDYESQYYPAGKAAMKEHIHIDENYGTTTQGQMEDFVFNKSAQLSR